MVQHYYFDNSLTLLCLKEVCGLELEYDSKVGGWLCSYDGTSLLCDIPNVVGEYEKDLRKKIFYFTYRYLNGPHPEKVIRKICLGSQSMFHDDEGIELYEEAYIDMEKKNVKRVGLYISDKDGSIFESSKECEEHNKGIK